MRGEYAKKVQKDFRFLTFSLFSLRFRISLGSKSNPKMYINYKI